MSGGGTIDLDWSTLTPEFAGRIVDLLNSALSNATRPSFIGPVSVSSFEFGTNAPEVEIIDIRDIYPDFLEGEDEDDESDQNSEELQAAAERERMMDEYDWVSRREGLPSEMMFDENGSNFSSPPFGTPEARPVGATSRRGPYEDSWRQVNGLRTTGLTGASALGSPFPQPPTPADMRAPHSHPSSSLDSPQSSRSTSPSPGKPSDTGSGHPDLQLHFRLAFESNLRLTISTSLQINYPSPMIMALPIKLCLTGLVLDGELVVAYEGSRRRIHLCFLDDQAAHLGGPVPASQSRYEEEEDDQSSDDRTPAMRASATISRLGTKLSLASPAGVRLLPTIVLESEIGQEDKHVLRNVARVERFIQDVIRKTIEDELVFPNFQTIVLPESSASPE